MDFSSMASAPRVAQKPPSRINAIAPTRFQPVKSAAIWPPRPLHFLFIQPKSARFGGDGIVFAQSVLVKPLFEARSYSSRASVQSSVSLRRKKLLCPAMAASAPAKLQAEKAAKQYADAHRLALKRQCSASRPLQDRQRGG